MVLLLELAGSAAVTVYAAANIFVRAADLFDAAGAGYAAAAVVAV